VRKVKTSSGGSVFGNYEADGTAGEELSDHASGTEISGAKDGERARVVRIRNYGRHVKAKLEKNFPQIIDKVIAESLAGNLAHTKFLFEIVGLASELRPKEHDKGEPNLGDLFIGGIKRLKPEVVQLAVGTSA
jgi:hypothetical protein